MSDLIFPSLRGVTPAIRRTAVDDVQEQRAASGKRLTSTYWTRQLTRYSLDVALLRSSAAWAEVQQILRYWVGHRGRLDTFLFEDPEDYQVSDHGFGVGNGATTAFQLQRAPGGAWRDALGTWATYTQPRTNRIPRSQELDNAVWAKGNASVAADAGVAPDGTLTADLLAENTSPTTTHSVNQQSGWTVNVGTQLTWSVYLKPCGRTQAMVRLLAGGAFVSTAYVVADLVTGAASGAPVGLDSYSIASVGGGWWRVSVTATATATGSVTPAVYFVAFGSNTYTGDGHSGMFFWGAQLEAGATATRYIPTTVAAGRADPAYWPDIGDGFGPVTEPDWMSSSIVADGDGLGSRTLVPWARTNHLFRSQEFESASWLTSELSATANATTAPDGTATADKLVESSATASRYITQAGPVALTDGKIATASVYAKAGERSWLQVAILTRDWVATKGAWFNVSSGATGTIGSGVTASIVPVGGGWFRCSASVSVGSGSNLPRARFTMGAADGGAPWAGDGSSGLYVWGAQFEEGPTAGDYIPTTTAAVARADYAMGPAGLVTFAAAPRPGCALAWTGNYRKRVAFVGHELELERIVSGRWKAGRIELEEVKA